MKVSINGQEYNGIWTEDTFQLETDMSLAEIESTFSTGSDTTIVTYDGEQEIGRYYNKGIYEITVVSQEPRFVIIHFNTTKLQEDTETEIRTDIDDSNDAIAELADIISDLCERVEVLEGRNE